MILPNTPETVFGRKKQFPAKAAGRRIGEKPGTRSRSEEKMWPDGEFKPSDSPSKQPDPSVHTLAPITILANYDKPKNGGTRTEMEDFVHASRLKEEPLREFSSQLTNGSTTPLVQKKSEEDDGAEYDPFAHRNVPHPTNNLETLIHLLKGSLGSGILAMPLAFAHAGLIFGVGATLVVGGICTYCIHMLVACAHILYRRTKVTSMSYSEVAEAAFLMGPQKVKKYRRLAKASIDTFLMIDLYGCCCVYVVFVAENLKQVVDHYLKADYTVQLYMGALLVPLVLVNLVRNLKYLAPFSLVANILMVTGLGITFYYVFKDLPEPQPENFIASVDKMPLFFGTAIFALEGIGVVMPLENNMKNPRAFIGRPYILLIGMTVVTVLYTAVGFFGYLRYGNDTMASITLNLPQDEILAQSVKVMIALTIFLTYALQFYVPMSIAWRVFRQTKTVKKHENSCEYVLRISMVVLSVGIAAAVPNLGPFISLVGATCLSMLGLIFPAVIELVTFWDYPGMGRFNWRIFKNAFLILFGILGFATGTFTSLKDIFENYGSK